MGLVVVAAARRRRHRHGSWDGRGAAAGALVKPGGVDIVLPGHEGGLVAVFGQGERAALVDGAVEGDAVPGLVVGVGGPGGGGGGGGGDDGDRGGHGHEGGAVARTAPGHVPGEPPELRAVLVPHGVDLVARTALGGPRLVPRLDAVHPHGPRLAPVDDAVHGHGVALAVGDAGGPRAGAAGGGGGRGGGDDGARGGHGHEGGAVARAAPGHVPGEPPELRAVLVPLGVDLVARAALGG